MAAIDLYGNDAQRIRDAYKPFRPQGPGDDEVTGWLSGSYGGGGINDWVNQIANSDEARRNAPQSQAPPTLGPTPGASHGYQPQPQQPQSGGDPWAQARAGLESVYQQYTGRAANPGDPDKWLSGGYGHGSGLQDYDKYVAAIMGSPEARSYRGPAGATPSQGSLEYWQQQGTPTIDIFDPTTGQLRDGWARTQNGYARTGAGGGGGANIPGPQGGNFESWLMQLTQGKPPSPQTLKSLEPILNQYGIRLGPPNARGWSDGVFLPDGTFLDMIEGATETGGVRWQTLRPTPGGGGQPFGGGVGQGVSLPGSQFSDPHTKLLEELTLARINSLQQGSDPGYQRLIQYLDQRFQDLQGPGRTGAEQEVIRTQALDPIENDRQAARKRMLERLSARGLTPDSGIAQQALLEIDKAFDGMRATAQNSMAADELQRREGRNQYAEGLAGAMYEIPQARNREAIGYSGALADLGPQRMQLAMQAAGMGGNPASMFQNLMQMAQLNQNSALLDQRNSGQLWSGLGSLAAELMAAGR